MEVSAVDIKYFRPFVQSAFDGDEEIVSCYDKSVQVKSVKEVVADVMRKIESVSKEVAIKGLISGGEPIGYLVFAPGNLVSFGLNAEYRTEDNLKEFWEIIKRYVGNTFECSLFDYNERAIKWLTKNGMNILFKNITILRLCQS